MSLRTVDGKRGYKLLAMEKTRNGKEIYEGHKFVYRADGVNFEYDELLTKEFKEHGTLNGQGLSSKQSSASNVPQRRGKLARVSPSDIERMKIMRDKKGMSLQQIADHFKGEYELAPNEVRRAINDAYRRSGSKPPQRRRGRKSKR